MLYFSTFHYPLQCGAYFFNPCLFVLQGRGDALRTHGARSRRSVAQDTERKELLVMDLDGDADDAEHELDALVLTRLGDDLLSGDGRHGQVGVFVRLPCYAALQLFFSSLQGPWAEQCSCHASSAADGGGAVRAKHAAWDRFVTRKQYLPKVLVGRVCVPWVL